MPDLLSPTLLPFVVGGTLGLALLLASRWRVVRAAFSVVLWAVTGFLLWSVVQSGALSDPTLDRLASLIGRPEQKVLGEELHVPMARDGHFWVKARINGVERRMMIDSGATVTAVPPATAQAAKLDISDNPMPALVRTANGTIAARNARIEEARLGNIVARDLTVLVSPAFGDTHVLGMNFLSRLESWRVEGRTMILKPHPQAEQS